ncbi:MAG: chemotaxis protein CheB [Candidatus Kapabacteria bacterium]|nr:chemotaxis protein CheB [Ignavibacteriota bacterium]MCW5884599.1 chemotaxis protein CheB [Candidatus Kapabacteria bacterium]
MNKKILVVEDELVGALLLKRLLIKSGYDVVVANNGNEAIEHLKKEAFDAVLTDWMMPQTDGIELIKYIRKKIDPIPYLILITALVSEGSKQYAVESGADDFIAKPVDIDDLLVRLKDGLDRQQQVKPAVSVTVVSREIDVKPPHVCVAIASSTGGPPTLMHVFKNLEWKNNAAYLVVQHGPAWMLETFSDRLRKESGMPVNLVANRMIIQPGTIYLAPGDKHIRVDKESYHVVIDNGPKENFVRPSAEPLFRSAADAYGKFCIGVVLTGLGRDGAQGAASIVGVKGTVIVQDPDTCIAPSMPNTVIESGIQHRKVPFQDLPKAISETVFPLAANLKRS